MRIVKIIFKIFGILLIVIINILLIAYLFVTFYPGVGKLPNKEAKIEYGKRTKYYYDNKFHNIKEDKTLSGKYERKKDTEVKPKGHIPVNEIKEFPLANDEITVTWLGHSSSLVQIDGKNILIDPVLSTYSSPVTWIGSKRFSDIALKPEDVPEIDVLLLSHDHYDHMDYETIDKIKDKVKKFVVPLGVENYLIGWGISRGKIEAVGWWEDVKIDNLTITSTPANHYSGRNPLYQNATWWCGYHMSDGDNSVYYTGDSGYVETFKEVYTKLGAVDLLMADSGQYNKAWKTIHMNPSEDIMVAKDVHAAYYMPVHWGAFQLSDHDWFEPAALATSLGEKENIKVITPKIGEYVKLSEIEKYTTHWWEDVK